MTIGYLMSSKLHIIYHLASKHSNWKIHIFPLIFQLKPPSVVHFQCPLATFEDTVGFDGCHKIGQLVYAVTNNNYNCSITWIHGGYSADWVIKQLATGGPLIWLVDPKR